MKLDVAIVGGGMAGGALARQLSRARPNLEIAVFERDTDASRKVGESTSEIAATYLARRLDLADYLHRRHLPKNGLRFFHDDANASASLTSLGEIGTDALPYHAAYQIDRARLDTDLLRMNEDDGVGVFRGARVKSIEPGAPHRLTIDDGERERGVEAKWLVDASGRARLLPRALGHKRHRLGHEISAAWVRLRGVADIDATGSETWRSRVRHTPRYLSTTHFVYAGYWIWLISLPGGVTSIGVVCEAGRFKPRWREGEGLLAFLREHAALRELLESAEVVDAMALSSLTYGAERFFSTERWACIGEAAAFTDPLYSPGADFIALANDFVTDLVARDADGDDFDERLELYDGYMKTRVESNLLLYRGQYGVIGSRALMELKWAFDVHAYYNLWLHSYLRVQHLDLEHVREQLRFREPTGVLLRNISSLLQAAATQLQQQGRYADANLEHFSDALAEMDFVEAVGDPSRTRKQVLRALGERCHQVWSGALSLMGVRGDAVDRRQPLMWFMAPRSLPRIQVPTRR